LKGIAISSDEVKVIIEIQSKCRKLPIDKANVRIVDEMDQEEGKMGNIQADF